MAAAVESRKRSASPFLDDPFSTPCHLVKRSRFTPCAGSMAPAAAPLQAVDQLDALRDIFPDAGPQDLEACFAALGGDLHATVQAYRAKQAQHALASRLAQAALAEGEGATEECAGVLVEQMAAATDMSDARNRASWILGLIKNAAAERAESAATAEAARLREENAALREQAAEAARLREEAAALRESAATVERDNAVLKRGVLAQQRRYEEAERAAAAMRKKVAELEMANYALGVRLREAEVCRFQAHRGPDVF